MTSALAFRAVHKRFVGVHALAGLDLDVPVGSTFALIGPNGAGKTTSFGVALGLLRATSGETTILGGPPSRVPTLRGRIGALLQDAPLPPKLTALEAVALHAELVGLGPAAARAAATEALGRAGLEQYLGAMCGTLSHGMAKRAGLAVAFLGEPELVLLDEPTAGLDAVSADAVRATLRERRGRCTLVVSSHDLDELQDLCDEAAILDRGRCVKTGTMAEFTGAGDWLEVELAPGFAKDAVPLVTGLGEVASATWDDSRRALTVRLSSGAHPESAAPAVLRALLDAGAPVVGVTRGRRLARAVAEALKA